MMKRISPYCLRVPYQFQQTQMNIRSNTVSGISGAFGLACPKQVRGSEEEVGVLGSGHGRDGGDQAAQEGPEISLKTCLCVDHFILYTVIGR